MRFGETADETFNRCTLHPAVYVESHTTTQPLQTDYQRLNLCFKWPRQWRGCHTVSRCLGGADEWRDKQRLVFATTQISDWAPAIKTPMKSFTYGAAVMGGRAIQELKMRGFLAGGQQVAIVQSGRQPIWRSASTHAIQVRQVERDPEPEE